MAFKWTRGDIETLIECIQQHSCIYSVRSKEYLDRSLKAEAFNAICIEMQRKNPTLTLSEIKKKWSNVRIQYMAEKRRILNSKKSGAGAGDILKPKLWCFDQLTFLNCHTEIKKSCSNIEPTSISDSLSSANSNDRPHCSARSLDNQIEDSSCEQSLQCGPKKKRKLEQSYPFAKELAALKALAENRRKEKKKYAWLGEMVTNQLEEFDSEDQAAACWEVQCVINKYVVKSLGKKKTSQESSEIAEDTAVTTREYDDEDTSDMTVEYLDDS